MKLEVSQELQTLSFIYRLQRVLGVKNFPTIAGDVRVVGLIPGSERSLGERHGSALQYSCLENSMDKGAWWFPVQRVTKSQI